LKTFLIYVILKKTDFKKILNLLKKRGHYGKRNV